METGGEHGERAAPFLRAARFFLLLTIVCQPLMSTVLAVGRHFVTPADFFYLLTAGATGLALLRRELRLRWHPAWWILIFYFAAMALSVPFSEQPERSALKLATQAYLLSLPVLAYHLLPDERTLRRALAVWLWTGAAIGVAGVLTLILWTVDPANPWVLEASHPKGTLAQGHYPRLDISFTHAAMLGNYLTVSILVALAAAERGWIAMRAALALAGAMAVAAFFSLTPGLAGLWLALGLWYWLKHRSSRRTAARLALAAGAAAALPYLVAAALTPFVHPTAPFLISLAGVTLAPAARLLFWIDAWKNFVAHLPFGKGIGTDAIAVEFQNPAGHLYMLSDAHNTYLNLGVQTGLPGLLALLLLIGFVARRLLPLPSALGREHGLRIGLGLAWLSAFAFQGLVGSFEDARFLWLLLGLFLAALDLSSRPAETRSAPRRH
jgi:O-antigen ligase